LPPVPEPAELSGLKPWRPAGLARLFGGRAPLSDHRWGQLRHIVIDELEENVAGLVVSAWPHVDDRGRLHFGVEEISRRIGTSAHELLELLAEARVVPLRRARADLLAALKTRELAVGDVFAAFVSGTASGGGGNGGADDPQGGGRGPEPVRRLLRAPVLDLTAVARDAVKAQASAAASGVIDEDFLQQVAEEFREDDEEPPTEDPSPTGGGRDSSGGVGEKPEVEPAPRPAVAREAASPSSEQADEPLRAELDEEAEREQQSEQGRRDRPMEMGV
jgi:hypothetical protein